MGLINISLPADGTTADVNDYNTPITTIVNAINGNLDNTNISSLSGAKITAGTIPGSAFDTNVAGGWNILGYTFSSVTALGNRSYQGVVSSQDVTGTISPGTRLRGTKTVSSPTQSTSLNGSTQYYSKTSPAGMTFTDDFVVSAWVKLSSYPASSAQIASRYNGTSGWQLRIEASGQVTLVGFNAGAANYSLAESYQSVPLNKWVHVTAQLDMSAFTATTTTSYVMIDGVDVPAFVGRGGTNPTSLINNVGNLEIGSTNGGTLFFPGKIAQVAIYSAKVTQATILASMHQTLAGTETSLISAYSFNNTINDLNTTSANNLTANGSAVATNADSPFGVQAGGTVSATTVHAIVQSATFSTNSTVVFQVPEGQTWPTSGGISAIAYSANKAPYGMPLQRDKWTVQMIHKTVGQQSSASSGVYYYFNQTLNVPIGEWVVSWSLDASVTSATAGNNQIATGISTSSSTATSTDLVNFNRLKVNNSTEVSGHLTKTKSFSMAAATSLYYLLICSTSTTTGFVSSDNSGYGGYITAENSYL